ncbi:MAG: hypothetical protein KBE65_08480 [Phycisphaerae bacterium]|nr:hypothetical protein [Phycisphaerae bacterium]
MVRHVVLTSALLAASCLAVGCTARVNSHAFGSEDLDLKPVGGSGDEPVEYTLHQRFSCDNALKRLGQIESALSSFEQLTEVTRATRVSDTLGEIENLDWETQTLGFPNWSGAIEGTLLKQQYIVAKLQYDLSRERLKQNETSSAEAAKARQEYQQAKQAFLTFWNSFTIID